MSRAAKAEEPAPLKTLSDWLRAPVAMREAALATCVSQISEQDETIQAWVDVRPQPATGSGPLDGIPFGAKEIIETAGLATEYGSKIYRSRVGTTDAAIIRDLRKRGAILLGKTRSTPFAYFTPTVTRNPRNLEHTPGGSSSGSAAAVAAGMVPLAIGTQTAGSILRPASFCGVVGFKPTFGLLSMEGILPFAPSLDTLGFFTANVVDMIAFWQAFGHKVEPREHIEFAAPDALPDVETPMADAFRGAIESLRAGGLVVRSLPLTSLLAEIRAAQRVIFFFEGAHFHEQRYREYGDRLEHLAVLVREGLQIPESDYKAAVEVLAASRQKLAAQFKSTPIILTPAAPGPAPRGLATTGDPRMNAPWTALGTPAISIPLPTPDLPLGLQLTADLRGDGRLLRAAEQIETVLAGTILRTATHKR